jgi:hypothetical protein
MTAYDRMILRRLRNGMHTVDQLLPWLQRHYNISRVELYDTLFSLRDEGHVICRGGTRWEATTNTSSAKISAM